MFIRYPYIEGEDERYLHACGRVRALGGRFLDAGRLERMLGGRPAELLEMLSDTFYAAYLEAASNYESVLLAARADLWKFFAGLMLDGDLVRLFSRRIDFHNLKVLIKQAVSEQDFSLALAPGGDVPADRIKDLVAEERYDLLPKELQRAVERAVAEYYENRDPRDIDFAVDREAHRWRLNLSLRRKNAFLIEWFRLTADLTNLRAALRLKWMAEATDTDGAAREGRVSLKKASLSGGYVPDDRLERILSEPWDALGSVFYAGPYASIMDHGAAHLHAQGSFDRLERLCEEHQLGFLACTRTITAGPEPVIAYLLARELEIRALRMIFVGKLNGLGVEDLRHRLPEIRRKVYIK